MASRVCEADELVLNLVGEKVALGPLRRDLMTLYHRWDNDFAVNFPLAEFAPQSREATEAWYEQASKGDLENRVGFTIYERTNLTPIGTLNLHMIDHLHRTAYLGIALGDKECWGRGYGTEAVRLGLGYAFGALSLHSVRLTVYSFNDRGIGAFTRAGFQPIGRWREAIRFAGRAYDILYMDCLDTEFTGPRCDGFLPTP